jgi:hypothetical protein
MCCVQLEGCDRNRFACFASVVGKRSRLTRPERFRNVCSMLLLIDVKLDFKQRLRLPEFLQWRFVAWFTRKSVSVPRFANGSSRRKVLSGPASAGRSMVELRAPIRIRGDLQTHLSSTSSPRIQLAGAEPRSCRRWPTCRSLIKQHRNCRCAIAGRQLVLGCGGCTAELCRTVRRRRNLGVQSTAAVLKESSVNLLSSECTHVCLWQIV